MSLSTPKDVEPISGESVPMEAESNLRTLDLAHTQYKHAADLAVLELSQNKVAVRAAVASLGDNHRRAVHMSFFENLTYREIAEVEGIPVGTIKTRILHAKKLLRHALHAHNTK